jgi:hypothetical protein
MKGTSTKHSHFPSETYTTENTNRKNLTVRAEREKQSPQWPCWMPATSRAWSCHVDHGRVGKLKGPVRSGLSVLPSFTEIQPKLQHHVTPAQSLNEQQP